MKFEKIANSPMRNYYYFIGALVSFGILLLILGFIAAGNPISQKDVQLDQTRMSDFQQISTEIASYYQIHKTLPKSITSAQTSPGYPEIKDPETQQQYEYTLVTSTSYKLCTTFSLDSKDENRNSYPGTMTLVMEAGPTTHIKGYDCLTYSIPPYALNNPPVYNNYVSPSPTGPLEYDAIVGMSFAGTYEKFDSKFNDFYITGKRDDINYYSPYNSTLTMPTAAPQEIHFHMTDKVICFDSNDNTIDCKTVKVGDSVKVKAAFSQGSLFTAAAIKDLTK